MVCWRRAMTAEPVFSKLLAKLVPMLRYDRSTVPAIAYTGTAMTSPGSALNA